MCNDLEVIITGDGSQTILDTRRNVSYHSANGAVTESKHIFIEAGLKHLALGGITKMKILEIGFGTGLNAFLTYLVSRDLGLETRYCGLESEPLPRFIVDQLIYPEFLDSYSDDNIFRRMHTRSDFSEDHYSHINLVGKAQDVIYPSDNNLVYYDAFGPSDQREMWEFELLTKVVDSMAHNGIIVTYCAQGQFKRNLRKLGCDVESLSGPPGKREIVRATFRKGSNS